jgi:hypothetical protein
VTGIPNQLLEIDMSAGWKRKVFAMSSWLSFMGLLLNLRYAFVKDVQAEKALLL